MTPVARVEQGRVVYWYTIHHGHVASQPGLPVADVAAGALFVAIMMSGLGANGSGAWQVSATAGTAE